jgi:hypothetical protein
LGAAYLPCKLQEGMGMDPESSTDQLREILLKQRNALLDLSTRNRLLNIPLHSRKSSQSIAFMHGVIVNNAAGS